MPRTRSSTSRAREAEPVNSGSNIRCAVCAKGLRNPVSVARGTGPVCAKHVKAYIDEWQNGDQARNAWQSWATSNGSRFGVERMALTAARSQFIARIRRQNRANPDQTVIDPIISRIDQQPSSSRQQFETLGYEEYQNGTMLSHSASERDYVLVTDSTGQSAIDCSCPDHQFFHHVCRHMAGYNVLHNRTNETADISQEVPDMPPLSELLVEVPTPPVETNRVAQAPAVLRIATEDEAAWEVRQDRNILVWHERHKHDGVFISENDAEWNSLKARAKGASNYGAFETENVLDGVDNTFGIELETEGGNYDRIARSLYNAGLSPHRTMLDYSADTEPGTWALKYDGSLDDGGEIVSPVLRDTPETWEAIRKVAEILRSGEAETSRHTGFHIHIGNQVLDDRGYRWQRLGRYMIGYADQYNRMGAASTTDDITTHRGGRYTGGLDINSVQTIKRNDTAIQASKKIINYHGHSSRYKMINTAKMIEDGVPTVEFRYPNGTTDERVIQRQIQLANATMMQSAYLRKIFPGADRLPHLFNSDPEGVPLASGSVTRFRQFLDTLGSDRLRLNATRLWLHGSN